jgi:acyl carrier protein
MKTNDIIHDFIVEELLQGTNDPPLTNTDDLIDSGIVDSLGIMSLLIFLENRFSVKIPGEDLIPENFTSIETITSLINRQLSI